MFIYVIFYMSSLKKCPIFNVFWQFLVFGKIQDGTQNGGHLGWRHRPTAARQPIICTSFCGAHQRLSTKGEIFSKYCNVTKTQGGFHQPPLVQRRGGGRVWHCLYVRGLMKLLSGNFLSLCLHSYYILCKALQNFMQAKAEQYIPVVVFFLLYNAAH